MKKALFEYAVIYNPPENETLKAKKDEDDEAKVLVPPKVVLAADLKSVQILAARDIPEKYLSKLDRVEVAVRPF